MDGWMDGWVCFCVGSRTSLMHMGSLAREEGERDGLTRVDLSLSFVVVYTSQSRHNDIIF